MKWIEIKNEIKSELISRNLKTPKRRLKELDNLETLFKTYFQEYIENPKVKFGEIDINEFKNEVSKYKESGNLNGAEKSLINEIYKQVKKK